jgi:hypothetical protein
VPGEIQRRTLAAMSVTTDRENHGDRRPEEEWVIEQALQRIVVSTMPASPL